VFGLEFAPNITHPKHHENAEKPEGGVPAKLAAENTPVMTSGVFASPDYARWSAGLTQPTDAA